MNQLEALRQHSVVVADSGDFQQIARFKPSDATTNPSLILKAAKMPAYRTLLVETVHAHRHDALSVITDQLLVAFGKAILEVIPGRVSTEVDARLSEDCDATVRRALQVIRMYEEAGLDTRRVLIKMAATWEGIQAARQLTELGIRCNLTLLFSLAQASACADAKVQLISPFVGRIYDWHKAMDGAWWNEAARQGANDPGVKSVREIHAYYQHHGIATEVMAASFRNTGQILALAGCDLLTISPELLAQLADTPAPAGSVPFAIADPDREAPARLQLDEAEFRKAMVRDRMASTKLEEGIRQFSSDAVALEHLVVAALKETL